MEELIAKIVEQSRGTGEDCARRTEAFVRKMLTEYSAKLGLSQSSILEALEKRRDYCAPNFYQEANFPSLDKVRIFADQSELKAAIPSLRFTCPACNAISTDPYECNSGKPMLGKGGKPSNEICNWKAYGLFRTFGKGLRFTIKEGFLDRPKIDEIFMPVDLAAESR